MFEYDEEFEKGLSRDVRTLLVEQAGCKAHVWESLKHIENRIEEYHVEMSKHINNYQAFKDEANKKITEHGVKLGAAAGLIGAAVATFFKFVFDKFFS